jgi:hypothetical protein
VTPAAAAAAGRGPPQPSVGDLEKFAAAMAQVSEVIAFLNRLMHFSYNYWRSLVAASPEGATTLLVLFSLLFLLCFVSILTLGDDDPPPKQRRA